KIQKEKSLALAETKRLEREALLADKENQQELYNDFKSRENELMAQLRDAERKKAALQAEIQKAIAKELEEARKKAEAERIAREKAAKEKAEKEGVAVVIPKENVSNADVKFGLTPEAKIIGNDFTANKGKLPYPVE